MAVIQTAYLKLRRQTWWNRPQVLCVAIALSMVMQQTVAAKPTTLEQKLLVAVQAINPLEVADLLCQGANPNYQTQDRSILDEAVIFRSARENQIRDKTVIVKLLLKAGATPNASSGKWKRTPIMTASGITTVKWYSDGHPLLIQLLLEAGADPNAVSAFHNSTALHFAADYAKIDNMSVLLAGGAKADEQDSMGNTPLTRVLLFRNDLTEQQMLEAVKLLLAAGAAVNHCNNDEDHPTGLAAQAGMFRVEALLLQALGKSGSFHCGRFHQ